MKISSAVRAVPPLPRPVPAEPWLREGSPFAAPTPLPPVGPVTAHDLAFVAMQNSLRASGGLARIREAERRVGAGRQGGPTRLLSLIAAGAVFSFRWHDSGWLPLFQFAPGGAEAADGLAPVLAELAPVYDGWNLGLWFAQPNPGLNMGCPADLLATDASEVLQAARCDRFIAGG